VVVAETGVAFEKLDKLKTAELMRKNTLEKSNSGDARRR
jgi:hypothetical protein